MHALNLGQLSTSIVCFLHLEICWKCPRHDSYCFSLQLKDQMVLHLWRYIVTVFSAYSIIGFKLFSLLTKKNPTDNYPEENNFN